MLIENKDKYRDSLIALWNKVFGDSEDYIRLFFKRAYFDSECFGEIVCGEVVSALYLLKCEIKFEGKTYKGRYLYAAATLPEHRNKGLMAKLIGEAQPYAREGELDFIALVPADDSLYDYYGKFGFVTSMYKYKLTADTAAENKSYGEITAEEFHKIRSSSNINMLVYNEVINNYAFECLKFSGNKIISLSDNSYYIEGEELFSNGDLSISEVPAGGTVIYTNSPFSNSEKIRNGMIYSVNDSFKPHNIYMNIALD